MPHFVDTALFAPPLRITLVLEQDRVPRIRGLLQGDCFAKVQAGCTLRQLLCRELSMDPEYVENDIKLVFLNSHPVDDIDNARIKDGAILSLSGPMPGLVGAALRKDGLSWMRPGITYQESDSDSALGDAIIQIKLFGQVMADWGTHFLKRGIYLKVGILADYLAALPDKFWRGCKRNLVNEEMVSIEILLTRLSSFTGWVHFSIHVDQ